MLAHALVTMGNKQHCRRHAANNFICLKSGTGYFVIFYWKQDILIVLCWSRFYLLKTKARIIYINLTAPTLCGY